MPLLDRWILERLHAVTAECLDAYDKFEFRKVFNAINQFCTNDLSAVYVDVTKDRMYCDARTSLRRRATQTAMHQVFESLCKLLAPILAYTADEAWEHAPFTEGTVHEQDFPVADPAFQGTDATKAADRLFEIRRVVQSAIEARVQAKDFTRNNEASVTLTVPAGEPVLGLLRDEEFAKEFFILAELHVGEGAELAATAAKTSHDLCPRCRRLEPLLESGLCARCASVC
jgi:isoleucyl-tRNA synthetase